MLTDTERLILAYTSKIEVTIPAKITSLNGMYCDCTALVNETGIDYPPFVNVPILVLGNDTNHIRIKNRVGDMVILHFPKNDMDLLKTQGKEGGAVNSDTLFSLNDCYAMPVSFKKIGAMVQPIEEIEIVGNVKINGNVEVVGELTASTDVKTGNISLKNHTHPAGSLLDAEGRGLTGNTGTPT